MKALKANINKAKALVAALSGQGTVKLREGLMTALVQVKYTKVGTIH